MPGGDVDPPGELRREADVAVVEADDAIALHRQQLAELLLPGDHLHPEPHDEDDGLGGSG